MRTKSSQQTTIAHMLHPMAELEIYPPDEEGYRSIATGRTMFVHPTDHSAVETIVDQLQASTAPMRTYGLVGALVPGGDAP